MTVVAAVTTMTLFSPKLQGSTLVLLTRPGLSTWSLSPLRIVLHRESSSPVPRVELDDSRRRDSNRKGESRRKGSRRRKGRTAKESEEKEEDEEQEQSHLQVILVLYNITRPSVCLSYEV